MTGIGGFLQEFLYGYTGLRSARAVHLAPSITGQLGGVVLTTCPGTVAVTVASAPGPPRVTLNRGRPSRCPRRPAPAPCSKAEPSPSPPGARISRPPPTRRGRGAAGGLVVATGRPGTGGGGRQPGHRLASPFTLPATLTVPLSGGSTRYGAFTVTVQRGA